MTKKTVKIIQNKEGQLYVKGKEGQRIKFVPLSTTRLHANNLDFIEIHRDLIDELGLDNEREVVMRILCLPPYSNGPTSFHGISRTMSIPRKRVKKIYLEAIKKIRRRIYEETKVIMD